MQLFKNNSKAVAELQQKYDEVLRNNQDWEIYAKQVYKYLQNRIYIPDYNSFTDYIRYAYALNPAIYTAVNRRSSAAKSLQWIVYRVKNQQKHRQYKMLGLKEFNLKHAIQLKGESMEEIDGTPLNKLLDRPNKYQSFAQIVEALMIYRDVTGNAYLYKAKNDVTREPLSLHILPGDKTKIVAGTYMEPIKGYILDQLTKDILLPENIIHWKYMNPEWNPDGSHLYGMPPLKPLINVIKADNAALLAQMFAFQNEGVKGILTGTSDDNIEFDRDQAKLLIEKFEKNYGPKNRGKVTFNRAPLNYVKIGETPVDMGMLDARRLNKEDIANVFRIHPALITSDASTLNNMTNAIKSLVTQSVLPDINDFRELLNSQLVPDFGEGYYIDYDLMAIPELQEDLEKLARTLSSMDWVTLNEKRTATQYDKYNDPAADLIYQNMGAMPLGEDFNTGFDNIPED
jgi:HK97 family phage portal protein